MALDPSPSHGGRDHEINNFDLTLVFYTGSWKQCLKYGPCFGIENVKYVSDQENGPNKYSVKSH